MRRRRDAPRISFSALCAACLGLQAAIAAFPEIAHIHPDSPGVEPRIIAGEGFDPSATEVWVWEPPGGEAAWREALRRADLSPDLPPVPPEGARRAAPIDIEPQVIVVPLEGSVVWVKSPGGFSKPYLVDVARPLWISDERVRAGGIAYIFGFALRLEYRPSLLAMRGRRSTLFPRTFTEARALRTADARLVHFQVPADAEPGVYEVFCHNSRGGPWGWRKAGEIEVALAVESRVHLLDVRAPGARGDGLADDGPAIAAAVIEARRSGATVFFAPGTYRVEATIVLPAGVRMRGVSREASIIRGTGDPSAAGSRAAWFHSFSPPTSVIRMGSRTALESLAVEGATWRGEGGYGLVEALPEERSFPIGGEVRDVTIADCRLRALPEDPISRKPLYLCAFHAGPSARRVKLLGNEIHGAASWGIGGVGSAARIEIVGNTFHGGAANDVVTINGAFSESLIDANLLVETPGRIVMGMGRHNYVRFNEIHQAFRGTWENAEELYLVHGGIEARKTVGIATGGSATTLEDAKEDWKPGLHIDSTVLILSGRGFGQYRRVADNSPTRLVVTPPWNVPPDETSEYLVAPQFVENAFFANLNDTVGRMSLWLDCIANRVEFHRDDHAKGADLWGEDASSVDEEGTARGLAKFFPAWYNIFANGWMDESALWLGTPGANPRNAHIGYPSFGNYVVGNRIREPHAYRTGFPFVRPAAGAGISIGGGSGRAGTSHTIVAENFIGSTYTGIRVGAAARKTFVLRNEFDRVEDPIADEGALTVRQGNRRSGGEGGGAGAELGDGRSDRDLPPWRPKPWTPDPADRIPPLFHDVLALKVLVSQPVYAVALEVESEEREAECRAHLREIFGLLEDYESKRGCLPDAAFYPDDPLSGPDSLRVLLAAPDPSVFACPTCGPELRGFGLNYAWNRKASGRRLADIEDRAGTWLLMDFVGAHDWMVHHGYCGHRRGVNILYADGTVRWSPPFSTEAWNRSAPLSWRQWARR